jgi:hypothetical protein
MWSNAMITVVWRFLTMMARGNLTLPEGNYATSLMLSSVAEATGAIILQSEGQADLSSPGTSSIPA